MNVNIFFQLSTYIVHLQIENLWNTLLIPEHQESGVWKVIEMIYLDYQKLKIIELLCLV